MKSKLIVLMIIAGASAFAETRFSISIGGYAPGYYAPPPAYYGPGRPHVLRPQGYWDRQFGAGYSDDRGWGRSGHWGEDPSRQHERAERYGLEDHQQNERFLHGDSPELWEHQAQEQRQLRHEQWHERNGDFGEGRAHDGSYRDR